jgi:hypothetical protein
MGKMWWILLYMPFEHGASVRTLLIHSNYFVLPAAAYSAVCQQIIRRNAEKRKSRRPNFPFGQTVFRRQ